MASGIVNIVTPESLAEGLQPRTWKFTSDAERATLTERAERYLDVVEQILTQKGYFVVRWEDRELAGPIMQPEDRVR